MSSDKYETVEQQIPVLFSKGNEIEVKYLSFRLVVAAWVLSACVLVNAYAGTLISYMTVPKFQPVPRSLKDLATDGQPLKLMTEYQSAFANDLLVYGIIGSSGMVCSLIKTFHADPRRNRQLLQDR